MITFYMVKYGSAEYTWNMFELELGTYAVEMASLASPLPFWETYLAMQCLSKQSI